MLGLADLEKGLLRELTPCCRQGHPERWKRRAVAGAGSQGALPGPLKISSVAHSLPGGPSGVNAPRLAPVPKLGRPITHEGTAAGRVEPLLLESVPSSPAASSSSRPGAAD